MKISCLINGHKIDNSSIRDMSHVYLWLRFEKSKFGGKCINCGKMVSL